jgi:hypothetical protein
VRGVLFFVDKPLSLMSPRRRSTLSQRRFFSSQQILALFKKGDYVHLDGKFEAGECGAINFGIESCRFLDLTGNRAE